MLNTVASTPADDEVTMSDSQAHDPARKRRSHLRRARVLAQRARTVLWNVDIAKYSNINHRRRSGIPVRAMHPFIWEPAHSTASASPYMHSVHSTQLLHALLLCMLRAKHDQGKLPPARSPLPPSPSRRSANDVLSLSRVSAHISANQRVSAHISAYQRISTHIIAF